MTIDPSRFASINYDLNQIDKILSDTLNGELIVNQGIKFSYVTLIIDNRGVCLIKTLTSILNTINDKNRCLSKRLR